MVNVNLYSAIVTESLMKVYLPSLRGINLGINSAVCLNVPQLHFQI